jgi:hypothetical protein
VVLSKAMGEGYVREIKMHYPSKWNEGPSGYPRRKNTKETEYRRIPS